MIFNLSQIETFGPKTEFSHFWRRGRDVWCAMCISLSRTGPAVCLLLNGKLWMPSHSIQSLSKFAHSWRPLLSSQLETNHPANFFFPRAKFSVTENFSFLSRNCPYLQQIRKQIINCPLHIMISYVWQKTYVTNYDIVRQTENLCNKLWYRTSDRKPL